MMYQISDLEQVAYANTHPQLEKWRRGAEHIARQLVVGSWLAQVTEFFL
jgi:hypothetical protein